MDSIALILLCCVETFPSSLNSSRACVACCPCSSSSLRDHKQAAELHTTTFCTRVCAWDAYQVHESNLAFCYYLYLFIYLLAMISLIHFLNLRCASLSNLKCFQIKARGILCVCDCQQIQ